jgi:hypothetical protein
MKGDSFQMADLISENDIDGEPFFYDIRILLLIKK